MKVGHCVIECLEELGIKYSAGIPGSHVLSLYDGLASSRIKHLTVKFEGSAAVIADCYGRLTGEPMLVLVTTGPGATNTVTGVAQGYGAASPMIIVSGSVRLDSGPSAFHGVDDPYFLVKIFGPITKYSKLITSPEEVYKVISRGYSIALDGRKGPVYIGVPRDIGEMNVKNKHGKCKVKVFKHPFSKHKLKEILKIISSKKVVFVLGAEVFTALENKFVIDVAEYLNSPIISQIEGLGYIPQDSKFYGGYIEETWDIHPSAKRLLEEADYIIFVGLRPGEDEYTFVNDLSKVIYIGYTRGLKFNIRYEAIGDLFRYLNGLKEASTSSSPWYTKAIEEGIKELNKHTDVETYGPTRRIHPGYVAKIISNYIPKDSLLVVDIGSHETWARIFMGAQYRVRYVYPSNYGAMGFAVPAAIGGWLAGYKDITVIIGDGGLLMCMEELATISELDVDAKIFVFNDSSYGMIAQMQKDKYGREISAYMSEIDFSKIASGMNVESIRVERDPEDVIRDAYKHKGPILVDIVTDSKVKYITFK